MRSLGSRQSLSGCVNGYSPMNSATAWTITTGGVCWKRAAVWSKANSREPSAWQTKTGAPELALDSQKEANVKLPITVFGPNLDDY